jgi:hypothetical protein
MTVNGRMQNLCSTGLRLLQQRWCASSWCLLSTVQKEGNCGLRVFSDAFLACAVMQAPAVKGRLWVPLQGKQTFCCSSVVTA